MLLMANFHDLWTRLFVFEVLKFSVDESTLSGGPGAGQKDIGKPVGIITRGF